MKILKVMNLLLAVLFTSHWNEHSLDLTAIQKYELPKSSFFWGIGDADAPIDGEH